MWPTWKILALGIGLLVTFVILLGFAFPVWYTIGKSNTTAAQAKTVPRARPTQTKTTPPKRRVIKRTSIKKKP